MNKVIEWLLDPVVMRRIATIPIWIVLIWLLLDAVTLLLP